ncbi:translation initiation factor IF-3, mitochondrial [Eurytemora carolleeae]|uniref:translation initiation factor IF-3, mitochondrial n=1 Tax=Eurytemora carolleeae TaxID=1294199 RepID=UPI000C773197|nr:translation initiation factor IF-3, mitochondrial [Eurytemora carolleeae]|eukprot:XP_023321468.1 translation initiation factor IF-3, mitochondrial-like [Eurytemora affinis]
MTGRRLVCAAFRVLNKERFWFCNQSSFLSANISLNRSIPPFVPQRTFNSSALFYSRKQQVDSSDLTPDTMVVFVDSKQKQTTMEYKELLEKVGERHLVRIVRTKKKEDIPHFKIMSDVDLEIALRKQKNETAYLGSKEILETEEGRIKQKALELSAKISEHDLRFRLTQIKKWLIKGDFVKVQIKVGKGGKVERAEELEKIILQEFQEIPEILGTSQAKLKIKII